MKRILTYNYNNIIIGYLFDRYGAKDSGKE